MHLRTPSEAQETGRLRSHEGAARGNIGDLLALSLDVERQRAALPKGR